MRIYAPTPEQERNYAEWLEARPPEIREVAGRFNVWTLYRLTNADGTPDQHRVTVYSLRVHTDGRVLVSVDVSGLFNAVGLERRVVDVDPGHLVECDLPGEDELVGSADLTLEQLHLPDEERQELLDFRANVGGLRPFGEVHRNFLRKRGATA